MRSKTSTRRNRMRLILDFSLTLINSRRKSETSEKPGLDPGFYGFGLVNTVFSGVFRVKNCDALGACVTMAARSSCGRAAPPRPPPPPPRAPPPEPRPAKVADAEVLLAVSFDVLRSLLELIFPNSEEWPEAQAEAALAEHLRAECAAHGPHAGHQGRRRRQRLCGGDGERRAGGPGWGCSR